LKVAGLGVLGGSLHAVCVRHLVRHLFTITGLDRQIPLARTVTEARLSLMTVRNTPVNGHVQQEPAQSTRPVPRAIPNEYVRDELDCNERVR
jgi:hypothetical protein